MRVYLAAAMTNPSRDLALLAALLEHLEARGHEVPTRHIVDPQARERDLALSAAALAQRDLAWIASVDALVAEVSTPSHGVGVEVTVASQRRTPVLLLHRHSAPVSRLMLGLPGCERAGYADAAEAGAAIDSFLARVGR